jgi:carboxypeptidase C (cathepsin A)
MRLTALLLSTLTLIGTARIGSAQDPRETASSGGAKESEKEGAKSASKGGDDKKGAKDSEEKPIVTKHETIIGGKPFKYTVTTGLMPISDADGKVEAHIFFMAYTADEVGKVSERPLMFSFNGGPGSSSVWLHLGALGPKRVKLPDDAAFPAPPFQLVDNEHSWLDRTDMVFIDPVGTGYSRPSKPELGKKFFGLRGDIASVGEFIRMYLTRYERWASPLFLVGESYGTTRAAGLAGHLIDRGVAFNGIVLVSSVLNFQTISFDTGNDLPYILYLPVYTATAWYHKKLSADYQKDLKATLGEAEKWAATEYARALSQGDQLSREDQIAVAKKLASFTGLEASFVDESNLRVTSRAFVKELLRRDKRTVGRLDSRYKGIYGRSVDEAGGYDPSMAAVMAPYTTMFHQYLRSELGYKADTVYHILGTGVGSWDWGPSGNGYPDTSEALRSALNQNPHMKLFIASGYFDLATPYFATEYTLDHMGLDPSVRRNIRVEEYEAGHMMYIHEDSLAKLKRDVSSFLEGAVQR